jgi:hypothetical protein
MQRVRMMLGHLADLGWEATVLAVRPEDVEVALDLELEQALPRGLEVHRVKAISPRLTRAFGFGSLSMRCAGAMRRAGLELLRSGRFDAVFFSTTQFGVFPLAEEWKRRMGTPYVLDFQDPWVSGYYDNPDSGRPPGGRLKYAVAQAFARRHERRVVREAGHVISVSPDYVTDMLRRYPEVAADHYSVMPFPGSEADFEHVRREGVRQTIFDPGDGRVHWVFAGRVVDGMELPLRGIFLALREAMERGRAGGGIVVHFVGTQYSEAKSSSLVMALAAECELSGCVTEHAARVPYYEALRCQLDAHALIMPGSDDAGYNPSKLTGCVLAGKPLLGVFHAGSAALELLKETRGGATVPFHAQESSIEIARRIVETRWIERGSQVSPETDWEKLERYLAPAMTRGFCEILERVIAQ